MAGYQDRGGCIRELILIDKEQNIEALELGSWCSQELEFVPSRSSLKKLLLTESSQNVNVITCEFMRSHEELA